MIKPALFASLPVGAGKGVGGGLWLNSSSAHRMRPSPPCLAAIQGRVGPGALPQACALRGRRSFRRNCRQPSTIGDSHLSHLPLPRHRSTQSHLKQALATRPDFLTLARIPLAAVCAGNGAKQSADMRSRCGMLQALPRVLTNLLTRLACHRRRRRANLIPDHGWARNSICPSGRHSGTTAEQCSERLGSRPASIACWRPAGGDRVNFEQALL
jgi:hypothetical protein